METRDLQFDPEDPRLTAFALGELDASERAEVEALLEQSAEARAFVDELRQAGELLAADFAAEPATALSDAQHGAIEEAMTGPPAAPRKRRGLLMASEPVPRKPGRLLSMNGGFVAAAAGALIAFGIWFVATEATTSDQASPFTYSIDGGGSGSARSSRRDREFARTLESLGYGGDTSSRPAPRSQELSESMRAELQALGYGSGPAPSTRGVTNSPPALRDLGYSGNATSTRAPIGGGGALQDLGYLGDDWSYEAETEAIVGDRTPPIVENAFRRALAEPRSTFSTDVDTAAYTIVRRSLERGRLPQPGTVRIEELVNYFRYDYPYPQADVPFSVITESALCPWNPEHRLVHIGLMGEPVANADRPGANLVFLLDVSGSMNSPDKLELVKRGLAMLVEQLDGRDSVGIVAYAGNAGVVLPSTSGADKETILEAIERLTAGGSTNGAAGITGAYAMAAERFVPGGINRVILATDGDFNVGVSSQSGLQDLIEEQAASGIFLTTLGFGTGNLRDGRLETLADHGNGHYAYIDSIDEARRVFVEELGATLQTIAKDVKLQVEFNPAEVQAWRLIGYENRVLAHADFENDAVDAGDIGAGHTVTAIYEVVPVGVDWTAPDGAAANDPMARAEANAAATGANEADLPPLRYMANGEVLGGAAGELATVSLRYKRPDGDRSLLIEGAILDHGADWWDASDDFRFSAGVVGFGMLLRHSSYAGDLTWDAVWELAHSGRGQDGDGRRDAFLGLVERARDLVGERRDAWAEQNDREH